MAPKPKPKKAAPKKAAPAKPPKATRKVEAKKSTPIASDNTDFDPGLILVSVSASELIPTGDYANVTVGPVTVTRYLSVTDDDDLVEQLNDLCELVEVGVVAEQRELVMKSLQNAAE